MRIQFSQLNGSLLASTLQGGTIRLWDLNVVESLWQDPIDPITTPLVLSSMGNVAAIICPDIDETVDAWTMKSDKHGVRNPVARVE